MDKFFKLKENGTTVSREIMAGLTTFFAMSYILFVNPSILAQTGMNYNAVFLATIIAWILHKIKVVIRKERNQSSAFSAASALTYNQIS